MNVVLFPCGPAANESELKAFEYLKNRLQSEPGADNWILLANLAFSVNYLVLRLNEGDAKALVRNVASSDQERPLIDKIKQMERFKALYFCAAKERKSLL